MMPKSAAFIRIKADVLRIVASIPEGHVSSYLSIGEYLDVMPRHVAYILAQLNTEEQEKYPWFRVVSNGGGLGVLKHASGGLSQADLLSNEGLDVTENSVAATYQHVFMAASSLESGVAPQSRSTQKPGSK
jgi:methylated-DNA-protein-cysteine methyltransferase related protein